MSHERTKIGILADEDTILGFSLCGLMECKERQNFYKVDVNTPEDEVEGYFNELVLNEDLSIIIISDFAKDKIAEIVDKFTGNTPFVIVIPSKFKNTPNKI